MADKKVTLKEYEDMCRQADWYYEMSDDQRVWRKGQEQMARIKELAKTSVEHEAVYRKFHKIAWG